VIPSLETGAKWWWMIDPYLFWSVVIMLLLGTTMVFSASMTTGIYAYRNAFYFLKDHIIGILLGLLGGALASFFPLQQLRKLSKAFLFLTLLLLVLVFVPGIGQQAGGSSRWLNLRISNFQPSEFAKLAIVFYMADALATYQNRIQDFWRGVIPFFIIVGIICLLVLIEPDLGTAIFLILLTFVMLFLGGSRITHLLLVWAILMPPGLFLLFVRGKEYWRDRLIAFLDPWKDPLGKGFHIIQSLIALGSGGIWGRGLGESRQKFFFLPDRHTDFIYAIIGEELGFLGTLAVLVLLGIILWRSWRIALNTHDEFGFLLAMGILSMIVLQAFINMGAVLRLLPVTGITFPLLSYGRSSLLVTLVSIGILFNIARSTGTEKEV